MARRAASLRKSARRRGGGGSKSRRMNRPRRSVRPKLAIRSKRRMRVRSAKAHGGSQSIASGETFRMEASANPVDNIKKAIQQARSCRDGKEHGNACDHLIRAEEYYSGNSITPEELYGIVRKFPSELRFDILRYAYDAMKVAIKENRWDEARNYEDKARTYVQYAADKGKDPKRIIARIDNYASKIPPKPTIVKNPGDGDATDDL